MQLVELHGGTIGVETVEGSGARFYFELPSATYERDVASAASGA